jgi:hypothetical protein
MGMDGDRPFSPSGDWIPVRSIRSGLEAMQAALRRDVRPLMGSSSCQEGLMTPSVSGTHTLVNYGGGIMNPGNGHFEGGDAVAIALRFT